MTDFLGFVCDSCGKVWALDKRTRSTIKFEKTPYCDLGSYYKDLCPECIIEPFNWTPTKRKKIVHAPEHRVDTDQDDEAEG